MSFPGAVASGLPASLEFRLDSDLKKPPLPDPEIGGLETSRGASWPFTEFFLLENRRNRLPARLGGGLGVLS